MELHTIRIKKTILEQDIEKLMEKFCEETRVSIVDVSGYCYIDSHKNTSPGLKIGLEEI